MTKFYPLASWPNYKERKHFNITTVYSPNIMAVPTGEFRPPRAGEWFLSGATVEAYRTDNNISTAYGIARLVKVKKVTTTKVVQYG